MKIDTFLIGAQKAGTSSLYNWIAQHPEIEGPEVVKDYHFWISPKLNKVGWSFIEKQFNNKAKLNMMGGVNYIFHPDAPEYLHRHNPNAKLILVLRNPIARAISAHKYFTKLGQETLTFDKALARERDNNFYSYEEISNWTYLEHGLYFQQLKRYLTYFEKPQIHVLIFEDLMNDKTKVMQQAFNFLQVDSSFIPEFVKVNETGNAKYLWLNRLLFGKRGFGKIISIMAKVFPLTWRINFSNWIREQNKTTTQFNKQDVEYNRQELDNYFIEDVRKLSDLLNIDLVKKWSFSEV